MADRSIIVFVRAPERDAVKTRLAEGVGGDRALAIYRQLAEQTVSMARRTAEARVIVCYTPSDARASVAAWLGDDVELRAQREGDLGCRMAGAIEDVLPRGGPVILIGTDCPGLDARIVERAFAELATADVVLGPALDGGYYLIGMTRNQPALFEGIPWSSSAALTETLSAAARAGLRVVLLERLRDIDTAQDWQAWCAESRAAELRTVASLDDAVG